MSPRHLRLEVLRTTQDTLDGESWQDRAVRLMCAELARACRAARNDDWHGARDALALAEHHSRGWLKWDQIDLARTLLWAVRDAVHVSAEEADGVFVPWAEQERMIREAREEQALWARQQAEAGR